MYSMRIPTIIAITVNTTIRISYGLICTTSSLSIEGMEVTAYVMWVTPINILAPENADFRCSGMLSA